MTTIEIGEGWQQWLARNLLDEHSVQSLVDIMSTKGIDRAAAADNASKIVGDPAFVAGKEMVRSGRKLESIMNIRCALAGLSASQFSVERRREVDRGEFLNRYYSRNEPVVLVDLTDHWPARTLWTLDYLADCLGDLPVEVTVDRESDPDYERRSVAHRAKLPFSEYAEFLKANPSSNDRYLTANNKLLAHEDAGRLWDDFDSPPNYFSPTRDAEYVFMWLGSAGTITPLHHDILNVMLVQVSGWKRVLLFDPAQTPFVYNDLGVFSSVDPRNPDYTRFPKFRNAQPRDVVLGPGDALFIPVGWWHHVEALEPSVSLSFTNFIWPNSYEWNNPS